MALVKLTRVRPYSLIRDFERVFNRPHRIYRESDMRWAPRINVSENEKAFELRAELPGLGKKDIEVTFKDGVLTLRGEKKQEKINENDNYYCAERGFGAFERSFRLTAPVEESKITAQHKNGVLTVTVPKAEIPEPAKITIK